MEFNGYKVVEETQGSSPPRPSRGRPVALGLALCAQTAILLVAIVTLSRPPAAPLAQVSPSPLTAPTPTGSSARDLADIQEHLLLVQRELKEVRAEQKSLAKDQLAKLEALSQAPQRARGPARTGGKRPAPEVRGAAGPAPKILVPRGIQYVGAGRYRALVDGSILVWIPGGNKAAPDGTPAKLEKGVFLGISEVSWGQYLLFCQATGWKVPSPTIDARARGGQVYRATANDPVFNVSYADAQAYLEWAGLRLPREREWRFAALECDPVDAKTESVNLGDLSRDWRWGAGSKDFKEKDAGRGNDGFPYLAPVQFYDAGRSRSGCYGLLGNLSEWVSDPAPEAEAGGEGRGPLVFCGASWYLPPNRARWNYRFRVAETFKGNALGFRVAISSR